MTGGVVARRLVMPLGMQTQAMNRGAQFRPAIMGV